MLDCVALDSLGWLYFLSLTKPSVGLRHVLQVTHDQDVVRYVHLVWNTGQHLMHLQLEDILGRLGSIIESLVTIEAIGPIEGGDVM